MGSRVLCTGLFVVLAVAGCGRSAPSPPTLPPVSVAPSTSPSAAPVPSAAQAATSQGAAAFARFWFATLNDAARTGDTELLTAISRPDCASCSQFAQSIEQLYVSGGRIEGGVFTVVVAEAPALDSGAVTTRVTVIYDVAPTRQIGSDGKVLRSVEALSGVDGDMRLARQGESWRVASLTV